MRGKDRATVAYAPILSIHQIANLAMEVICLQEEAFWKMVDEVVTYIKTTTGKSEDRWVDGERAKQLLNVDSDTTLQKYRDEGKIRFHQDPDHPRNITYDIESIAQYKELHAKEPFRHGKK
jgi:hypothetical protein